MNPHAWRLFTRICYGLLGLTALMMAGDFYSKDFNPPTPTYAVIVGPLATALYLLMGRRPPGA